MKLFEAALWELAEGDGDEAEVGISGEGDGEDSGEGGAVANAVVDSLSRGVAGKLSLEEEAVLHDLENLPNRSKLRNLDNLTDG